MFGIVSILSERFPSPCLVVINMILNLAGVAFAITAIVLYSISVADIYVGWMCERYDYWSYRHTTPSPSVGEEILKRKCLEGIAVLLLLFRSIHAVLIVLSVLELCIVISSVVLGIKSLRSKEKGQNKSTDDPELYSPLLEEVTTKPSV